MREPFFCIESSKNRLHAQLQGWTELSAPVRLSLIRNNEARRTDQACASQSGVGLNRVLTAIETQDNGPITAKCRVYSSSNARCLVARPLPDGPPLKRTKGACKKRSFAPIRGPRASLCSSHQLSRYVTLRMDQTKSVAVLLLHRMSSHCLTAAARVRFVVEATRAAH